MYQTRHPEKPGLTQIDNISLREVVPLINWTYFFNAWRMPGRYNGMDALCECSSCKAGWLNNFPSHEQEKANQALNLYLDARALLRNLLDEGKVTIRATLGLYPAYAENDTIYIRADELIKLPMLRQQRPSADGYCYSLADFIAPENDHIGIFAATVLGAEELANTFVQENDTYQAILIKTVADRLAEATSEWLHYHVRKKYWGYAPNETLSIQNLQKGNYQGIRPAVGYPSLPDQSIIFELDKILGLNQSGITLTENGAMHPNASVCGLYMAHPQARYFMIGNIDKTQLTDYALRRGKTIEEMKKWLAGNIH